MIKLCGEDTRPDFDAASAADPIYGAMNASRLCCYGHLPQLALFWVIYDNDQPVGTLSSVMGDGILSCGEPSCLEEAAQLIAAAGITSLLGEHSAIQEIQSVLGGESYTAPTMLCQGGTLCGEIYEYRENWRRFYNFLCGGYPYFAEHSNYDDWLSSLTMRINHGTATAYALERQGELLAVGIIGFRGEKSGEIGSIVTAPALRRQGLGRQMTSHLAAVLAAEGRTAFLHLAEESLVPFYESAGFHAVGEWSSLKFKL